MTREKAIKYFSDEIMYCRLAPALNGCEMREDWQKTIDVCEMAIAALRDQEERRWIPVTERLPEKAGTYFVVTKTGAVTFARFYPEHDITDCTGKFIRHEKGNFQTNRNVIYWMPLPEPPKEVSE